MPDSDTPTQQHKNTSSVSVLAELSRDELVASHQQLESKVDDLSRQLDWLKNQLFGQKAATCRRSSGQGHHNPYTSIVEGTPRSRTDAVGAGLRYLKGRSNTGLK